ncbi:MAG: hydrolase [Firmicutes bacterium]|nr:hydrolase [Bacillota bacterium]
MRHPHQLVRSDSVLVVVDVQDKLLHAIQDWQEVLANTVKMIKFAQELSVPVLVTEQYPKGLGPTNLSVKELFSDFYAIEKTAFSCLGAENFYDRLLSLEKKSLVLVGIEAHICVLQTALEAMSRGFHVHIISDAVGSRRMGNKLLGLDKIKNAGGIISGVEIALYEWLEYAGSDEFKAVLPLIK